MSTGKFDSSDLSISHLISSLMIETKLRGPNPLFGGSF